MSTKINARSPYYLKVKPIIYKGTPDDEVPDDIADDEIESLGNFTCDIANLIGFAVDSGGQITQPRASKGTILSSSVSSFDPNTSGSPIPQTVTYTIRIPQEYDNYSSSTIDCDVTADQPTQTAQEDPNQNATCPTTVGSIANLTNSDLIVAAGVNLASKFAAGTGDSISKYVVTQIEGPDSFIVANNQVAASFRTPQNCMTGKFQITAYNSDESCYVHSNVFTVTGPCPDELHCTDDSTGYVALGLNGGGVDGDGTIHNPLTNIYNIRPIRYERPLNTTVTSITENDSGSNITINDLYFVYTVPAGFSNAGDPLKCLGGPFTQPSTTLPARDLVCSDVAAITGISITSSGAINTVGAKFYIAGDDNTYLLSDYAGWVRNVDGGTTFPVVSTSTPRTVYYNFKVPTSTWSNHNSYISVDCSKTIYQQAADICGSFTAYLSNQSFSTPDDICGDLGAFEVNGPHKFNVSSFAQISTGKRVCLNGTPKNGNNKYWVVNQQSLDSTADNYSTWFVIKIDRDGNITEELYHECEADI
jgi:hypothetical protein